MKLLQKAFAFPIEEMSIDPRLIYFKELAETSWLNDIKSLDNMLSVVDNAFVEMRYSFESCNPIFLPIATRALRIALLYSIGQFWEKEYLLLR